MAISKDIYPLYAEIFGIPRFLSGPFLMFGYQIFDGPDFPERSSCKDVKDLLISRGVKDITVLDLFDSRADLKYDMNLPIPQVENERYSVVSDIGCLEHVFDTKQCLENCMRMVKVGGLYMLVTVVNGYYGHGLHVFNPEGIKGSLELNNFEIVYLKYSSVYGKIINDPSRGENIMIWIVARKKKSMGPFIIPQQPTSDDPEDQGTAGSSAWMRGLKRLVTRLFHVVWEFLLDLRHGLRHSTLYK